MKFRNKIYAAFLFPFSIWDIIFSLVCSWNCLLDGRVDDVKCVCVLGWGGGGGRGIAWVPV